MTPGAGRALGAEERGLDRTGRSDSVLYYIIAIILIVIDQLTKAWVRITVPLGQSVPFLPYVMDLTYVQNTGAAFSSFSGMTKVLAVVSLTAVVAVALLLRRDFFPGKLGRASLALILAGAAGNLIDRAVLGYVTDMFETTFIRFPVFNVADICVVLGAVLMVAYVLFFLDKDREGGR